MKSMFSKLFERGKIGRLEIDNRVIKAPTELRHKKCYPKHN